MVQHHLKSLEKQLSEVYHAIALAYVLNRTLILPKVGFWERWERWGMAGGGGEGRGGNGWEGREGRGSTQGFQAMGCRYGAGGPLGEAGGCSGGKGSTPIHPGFSSNGGGTVHWWRRLVLPKEGSGERWKDGREGWGLPPSIQVSKTMGGGGGALLNFGLQGK